MENKRTLVVTMDAAGGISFNGRRCIRDKAINQRMNELLTTRKDGYLESRIMFPSPHPVSRGGKGLYEAWGHCLENGRGGVYFCTVENPLEVICLFDEVVIFRVDAEYPCDVKFDCPMDMFVLADTKTYKGCYHETITEETYKKKGERNEERK